MHCPFEELDDLCQVLDQIRTWPDIREPRPGIFYIKRLPFLHFHVDRSQRRWADVREGPSWGTEVEIPYDASMAAHRKFLEEVERRYALTISNGRRS
jgi:hypothetical protein